MNKRLPSAAILAALLLVLCIHALAAGTASERDNPYAASFGGGYLFTGQPKVIRTGYEDVMATPLTSFSLPEHLQTQPSIQVNGRSVGHLTERTTVGQTEYLSAASLLAALFPDTSIQEQGNTLTATGSDLTLRAESGKTYFTINGRPLYVPDGVILTDGELYLPGEILAKALGCSYRLDTATGDLSIKQVSAPLRARTYDQDDLYWLSHAIYSESGNQPMAGRIAVGTVILNRVADDSFPDSIYDVVFAPGQFSPVANGTIYLDPDPDSIVAAQLCLDGVREADDCLYFNVTTMRSWADYSRTYVCTIGGHNFYL